MEFGIHESLPLYSGGLGILAGDHLYRMNYAKMVLHHRASGADITVGTTPVSREEAKRFGILKQGSDGRLVDYAEKPEDDQRLDELVCRPGSEKPYRASMGIYVIRADGRTVGRVVKTR